MRTVQGIKTGLAFSPHLWGAHRYTTGGGMCALRGLLRRALSVLQQPTGDATLPLRCKERTYPFVNFAFRQKPKCGFYLPTKSIHAPRLPYRQNVGALYG